MGYFYNFRQNAKKILIDKKFGQSGHPASIFQPLVLISLEMQAQAVAVLLKV
jgi:hypothetical protein